MSIRKGNNLITAFKTTIASDLVDLSITPTTSSQTFNHTGHDGYDIVSVSPVTSSIDSDIKASNIKSGVNILGVNGSVVELQGETRTITPTTSQQTITPSSGKNGITSATVSAVTSSIDSNIQAGNIKKDVTILGVTGTLESGGGGKNVQGYHGIDTVSSTSMTATDVSLTVAKTGTYKVSWTGCRNTNSGTSQSQLYIGNTAYGSAQGTFTNTYYQSVILTGVSLTQGQTVTVRARARSTSYRMMVGNLIIEEQ